MISLNPYDQRDKHRIVERARLRGLAEQAREDRQDLHRALLSTVSALEDLKTAGIPALALDDMARAAHDAISERDAVLRADIDGEFGPACTLLIPAEPLDLSELETFFVKEG